MSSRPHGGAAAPVIVELVGTPGAGKTTVAAEIVVGLRRRGVDAATTIEAAREHARRTRLGAAAALLGPARVRRFLLWQVFYAYGLGAAAAFVGGDARFARSVIARQLRRPIPAARKRHEVFWFLQLGGRRRLLTATGAPGEVLVVDDGFLHRTAALAASHVEIPERGWVEWYVDAAPSPDLVVHVTAPVDICERRVLARGVWRHSRALGQEEIAAYVRNAGAAVELAVDRARARGWNVLSIDNGDRRPDELARDVDAICDRIAPETTPPAATGRVR